MEAGDTGAAPAITVLMSVRDGGRHLPAAIDSILGQSCTDFEFLILDDGSTDDSRAVVAGYDDPRIRLVVNGENLGLTRSLNRGIAEARGRYIARMDADDESSRERLARQLAHLESHPGCGLIATWARVVDANSAEVRVARTPALPGALRRELHRGNCITHGTVMMRAAALRRVGGYDESMPRSQDYDLWLRLCDDYELACLPEVLYSWREHGGGISSRHAAEQESCAERARRAAIARRVGRVMTGLARGEIDPRRAAARLADEMREHEQRGAPRPSPPLFPDRLWWRLPGLQRWRYARRHRPQLDEMQVIVGLCSAGSVELDAARDELVELIESTDP